MAVFLVAFFDDAREFKIFVCIEEMSLQQLFGLSGVQSQRRDLVEQLRRAIAGVRAFLVGEIADVMESITGASVVCD